MLAASLVLPFLFGAGAGAATREPKLAQAAVGQTPSPAAAAILEPLRNDISRAVQELDAGRCAQAIPIAEAAAKTIREKLGGTQPDLVAAMNVTALCNKILGQYEKSEAGFRQAIDIAEKAYGPDTPESAVVLDNLGNLYLEQRRYAQAEPLKRHALETFQNTTGADSADTMTSMQNLAAVLDGEDRLPEAEALYRKALAIAEKVYKPDDPATGRLLDNMAGVIRQQNRLAEAGPYYDRAIAIFEHALGPDHPDTALAIQNHAILLSDLGEDRKSEAEYLRAIAINERNYGPLHPVLVPALTDLANTYIDQVNWSEAVTALRRAAAIIEQRRGLASEQTRGLEQRRNPVTYRKLVQSLLHHAGQDPALFDEAFKSAQIALGSEASIAVSEMAARFAAGDAKIGERLRERQDLVNEAETRDSDLVASVSRPKEQRNPAAEQETRSRILA